MNIMSMYIPSRKIFDKEIITDRFNKTCLSFIFAI